MRAALALVLLVACLTGCAREMTESDLCPDQSIAIQDVAAVRTSDGVRIDWVDLNAVTEHTIYRRQDGGEWEPIAAPERTVTRSDGPTSTPTRRPAPTWSTP